MNTLELRALLVRHDNTRKIFQDVYAADQLPLVKITKPRWLLIYNCCPINLPGLHWVAIFGNEKGEIEFFDSFGLPPNMYEGVQEFLKGQRPNSVIYNHRQLQSTKSDACGHYCLFFSHYRSKGVRMEKIVEFIENFERDTWIKLQVLKELY